MENFNRYVLGAPGSGKSTLLKHFILDAINADQGVCFISAHRSDVDDVAQHIPRRRLKDTILFDPTDAAHVFQWNFLGEANNVPLMATVISDALKDAYGYHGMTTPVMDMYLYFTIASLIEAELPFADSVDVLKSEKRRNTMPLSPPLREFWDSFDAMTAKEQRDQTASTLNKLYVLFGDMRLRRLFSVTKGRFSMSDALDGKIVLVRLPIGELGASKVSLVGSLFLSQLHLAALRRTSTTPFPIIIDELHHYTSSVVTEMMTGLRKFGVSVTGAHQYIDQIDKAFFAALMGNTRERYVFNVSREDAFRFEERGGNFAVNLNLDELPPYRYRRFPCHPSERDGYVEQLIDPNPRMMDRVLEHTRHNYCLPQKGHAAQGV